MQIRRATDKDLDAVNSLLHQVLEVHASGRPDIFKSGTKKYMDDELIEIFNNDKTPVFVAANENNEIVGYAFCVFKFTENNNVLKKRKEFYIDDLCVDEKYRGQNIGKSILEYVCDFASNEGFDAITLNVWNLNQSAIKFYEKCGFLPLKINMEKIL